MSHPIEIYTQETVPEDLDVYIEDHSDIDWIVYAPKIIDNLIVKEALNKLSNPLQDYETYPIGKGGYLYVIRH